MSEALNLYRLQQLDSQLAGLDVRLKSIQLSLENNTKLSEARSLLEAEVQNYQLLESEIKKMEQDAVGRRVKIKEIESRLYGGKVSNPKELQELQQELDLLKRQLASLEESELEQMMDLDNLRISRDNYRNTFETIKLKVEQDNSILIAERNSARRDMERLLLERQATIQSIDPASLTLYDRIRGERHGIAVTTISDNSCDACGAVLTPAQQQSAHHSNKLYRCLSCGRIIYS